MNVAVAAVWRELVGQERVIETLTRAVDGAMTHAWLFTGPPGSGRSNAAVAFATALQCADGGCGQCPSCIQAGAGSHPDISVVNTDGLSIGVDAARDIVRKAAMSPSVSPWQIIIIEDADRLTEQAANALLKAIEEPTRQTVWMLCAPAIEDVIMTIRSRCRPVGLRTPPAAAIADLLIQREGIDPAVAQSVATASQGHIGRARALARDPEFRARRAEVLALPARLRSVGDAFAQAKRIEAEATSRANDFCDVADARELSEIQQSFGVEERGRRPEGYASALGSLKDDQKRRRKRMARDSMDGVLIDLLSVLRDVLSRQLGVTHALINADVEIEVDTLAQRWSTEHTWQAIDSVTACRHALTANAAPLVALETMLVRFIP